MATDDVLYFDRCDLEDALGAPVVASIYDDDANGQGELRALKSCRRAGTAEVRTWLYGNYPLPTSADAVTDDLRFAALNFGIAYSLRRRADVVKAMNLESWTTFQKAAEDRMKRFIEGLQDLPPAANDGSLNDGGPAVFSDPARYNDCD